MLEKGKVPLLGKLRVVHLIEADLKLIMRIFLGSRLDVFKEIVEYQSMIMGLENGAQLIQCHWKKYSSSITKNGRVK